MKKFITAAALLAASTALASASVTGYCPWPDSTSSLSDGTFNAQEIKLSSLDGFESGSYYSLESVIFPRVSGSYSIGGILVVLDSSYTVVGYAAAYGNKTGQRFGTVINKATTAYDFTYAGSSTIAASVAPVLYSDATYLALWVAAGTSPTVGETLSSTVSIVTPSTSSNGGQVYSSVSDDYAGTYGAAKSVSFDENGTLSVSDYTSDGTKVLSTYGVTATLTTIPEPSAFGLLAGIGALALVAARRRRRAK